MEMIHFVIVKIFQRSSVPLMGISKNPYNYSSGLAAELRGLLGDPAEF